MKSAPLLKTFAESLLICTLTAAAAVQAQDKGYWRAVSNTARSITGDVTLADEKISINFAAYPMVKNRNLEKAEIASLFDADSNAPGDGALYHLNIPASKKFLNKNTLCGAEDAQWMVTYVSGKSMRLALFSGTKPPVFTFDAISNSTDICGTFTYTR
jgi:hypothetical protein